MDIKKTTKPFYGLMAEFADEASFVHAAHKLHEEGYKIMDAYSPYPVEEIMDILHLHQNKLPRIVLTGAICGGVGGFLMECFASIIHYPLNIGGRPLFSWPSFIPPAYELTILFAAFSAVIGMCTLNNLPMPYHPVFNVPAFEAASDDRFFICIESEDPKFDLGRTRQFLEGLKPVSVAQVEN